MNLRSKKVVFLLEKSVFLLKKEEKALNKKLALQNS